MAKITNNLPNLPQKIGIEILLITCMCFPLIYAEEIGEWNGRFLSRGAFEKQETPATAIHTTFSGQNVAWQDLSVGIPSQIGVAALTIAPSKPEVIYMATADPGGLYMSTDGGFGWEKMANGLSDVGVISLATHPTDPHRVYAGTANGLYRTSKSTLASESQDEMETLAWERVSGVKASSVYAILLAPEPSSQIFVGSEEGLFWSEDDGDVWHRSEDMIWPVLSLAVLNNSSVYAGTAGQGLLLSEDSGRTWRRMEGPLAQSTVLDLQITQDKTMYCWTGEGLFCFDLDVQLRDQKTSPVGYEVGWQKIDLPNGWAPFGFAIGDYARQRSGQHTAKHLYVGSKGKGVLVSQDIDSPAPTWQRTGDTLNRADITCLQVHPNNPNIAFIGTKFNGLYRTSDGGLSWQFVSSEVGPRTVLALAQDPRQPSILYAGTVDGLYGTGDSGGSWQLLTAELGKLMVQGIAIDPSKPNHLYAATNIGIFHSENRGGSWEWSTENLGRINVFNISAGRLSPDSGVTVLYAGSWGNNLLHSLDSGQTWAPIHNGLETLSIHAFAQDTSNPDILFAGAVEQVYKSEDGGASWFVANQGMRPQVTTFTFALDSDHPERIYAGTTAGIYRSDDQGNRWMLLTDELLDVTVNALAVHPTQPELLYAGTEHHGLYASVDAGEHWTCWGFNDTSVYSILVDEGWSVWVGTAKGVFRNAVPVNRHAE